MESPWRILPGGAKVRTHQELEKQAWTMGLTDRRPGAAGQVVSAVGGYGGDCYHVRHEDGCVGMYSFSELELEPASLYRELTEQLIHLREKKADRATKDAVLERMDTAWGRLSAEEMDEAERWNEERLRSTVARRA